MIADIVEALSQEHGEESFRGLALVGGRTPATGALLPPRHKHAYSVEHAVNFKDRAALIGGCGEEAEAQWREIELLLSGVPTLLEIPEIADSALVQLAALQAMIADGFAGGTPAAGRDVERGLHDLANLTTVIEIAAGAAKDVLSRLSSAGTEMRTGIRGDGLSLPA